MTSSLATCRQGSTFTGRLDNLPYMPLYEFYCKHCGHAEDHLSRDLTLYCPDCGRALHRNWSFAYKEPFQPHYNHAVGKYVSSNSDFNDALKRGGDEAGSTFTRIDAGDLPRTEEGLEATARATYSPDSSKVTIL